MRELEYQFFIKVISPSDQGCRSNRRRPDERPANSRSWRESAWTQQCWLSINNRVCGGGRGAARLSAREVWREAGARTAAARQFSLVCRAVRVRVGSESRVVVDATFASRSSSPSPARLLAAATLCRAFVGAAVRARSRAFITSRCVVVVS